MRNSTDKMANRVTLKGTLVYVYLISLNRIIKAIEM